MGSIDKRKSYNKSWENLILGPKSKQDNRLKCECLNCGCEILYYPSQPKKFCSLSCKGSGQSKGLTSPMRKGTGIDDTEKVVRKKYYKYKKDGFVFSLEEYKHLLRECYYCGSNDKKTLGLDRINNELDHNPTNCLVACELCNRTRGHAFSMEQMKKIGKVISSFNMDGWRIMSKKSIEKMMMNENWRKSKFNGK